MISSSSNSYRLLVTNKEDAISGTKFSQHFYTSYHDHYNVPESKFGSENGSNNKSINRGIFSGSP